MGKLIFLDIDGTLVRPRHTPSKANVEAIRRARSNGHKVFVSTGRMEVSVAENVRTIGFDGGIYGAGGQVVVNGVEIINRPMPTGLARQIIDVLREGDISFKVETAYGTFPDTDRQITRNGADDVPIYKILFSAVSKEQADWIYQRLNPVAKVVCFIGLVPGLSWIPGEISDRDINKGKALSYICQYLGADPSDCIAFGDSMNDAEILQVAGNGIAMGNAEACVKEIANQVCESCENDGVAKMLVRLGLI